MADDVKDNEDKFSQPLEFIELVDDDEEFEAQDVEAAATRVAAGGSLEQEAAALAVKSVVKKMVSGDEE